MASEYSRELSVKVSAGQRRLASMGFWQGGNAPFGMARQLVDQFRKPKGILGFGEWKSISTDRVVLTLGSPEEVETVKLAFDLYTKRGKSRHQIADILNKAGRLLGRSPWTIQKLRDLLMDPIYKGTYAYGKSETRSQISRRMPSDKWQLRDQAFPGIISDKQWNKARDRIRQEIKPLVDAEMLDDLRRLWKIEGRLNSKLINTAKDTPSAVAYQKHFGGMNEAYKRIGYPPPKDYSFVHAIKMSRQIRREVCDQICDGVKAVGGTAKRLPTPNKVLLNSRVTVHVSVCKGCVRPELRTRWRLLFSKQPVADVLVIARLQPPSSSILDFFVVPAVSQLRGVLWARDKNDDAFLDLYRVNDLRGFVEAFRCFSLRGEV